MLTYSMTGKWMEMSNAVTISIDRLDSEKKCYVCCFFEDIFNMDMETVK